MLNLQLLGMTPLSEYSKRVLLCIRYNIDHQFVWKVETNIRVYFFPNFFSCFQEIYKQTNSIPSAIFNIATSKRIYVLEIRRVRSPRIYYSAWKKLKLKCIVISCIIEHIIKNYRICDKLYK